MARPGILYEDILKAISTLTEKNQKITINNIRSILGKGSPTTISVFLKKWRDEKKIDETIAVDYQNDTPDINNKPNTTEDSTIQKLLEESSKLSSTILNHMSEEWNVILNEENTETKVRKLYAALVKEQTRRETAEQLAKESRLYADEIKNQATKRISDLRHSLDEQISFLQNQIRQLKKELESNLDYYRIQLSKANQTIAKKINT